MGRGKHASKKRKADFGKQLAAAMTMLSHNDDSSSSEEEAPAKASSAASASALVPVASTALTLTPDAALAAGMQELQAHRAQLFLPPSVGGARHHKDEQNVISRGYSHLMYLPKAWPEIQLTSHVMSHECIISVDCLVAYALRRWL